MRLRRVEHVIGDVDFAVRLVASVQFSEQSIEPARVFVIDGERGA
jgi:hypothetical protein